MAMPSLVSGLLMPSPAEVEAPLVEAVGVVGVPGWLAAEGLRIAIS